VSVNRHSSPFRTFISIPSFLRISLPSLLHLSVSALFTLP
jgi:hypothetical protein